MKKKSIEDAKLLGGKRGFKCLSIQYVNSKASLLWSCNKCNYRWEQNYNNIKNGSGCPKCAGKIKLTIEDMRTAAKRNDGKFVSDTYTNSYTKHTWECKNGHRWNATPSQILHQGQWCPKCSGNAPKTYEELEAIVKKKKGKLLTPFQEYSSGKTKIIIKCYCGYKWKPLASSIFQGKWCPKCGKSIRIPFKKIQDEANKRGGTCLSSPDKYLNNKTKLEFKCACGNIFESYWNNIQQGRWCPNCASSREERICRAIFEQFFSIKFISHWPEWLKNENGKRLELDGYNKDLQIAFEYQGRQHYEQIDKFHADEEALKKRFKDDEKKKISVIKKGLGCFLSNIISKTILIKR